MNFELEIAARLKSRFAVKSVCCSSALLTAAFFNNGKLQNLLRTINCLQVMVILQEHPGVLLGGVGTGSL